MNPDLESIIKQTKHSIPFSFFTGKYFYKVWLIKAKTSLKVEIGFQENNSLPNYAGLSELLTTCDYTQSWTSVQHKYRKLEIMKNFSIIWFEFDLS